MLAAVMHVTLWLELFQDSKLIAKVATLSITDILEITQWYLSTIWVSTTIRKNEVLLCAIDRYR